MDNPTLQTLCAQLEADLFCNDCKAARFLIWEKDKHAGQLGGETPQHSVIREDCVYAVHCDYFKRRVEAPDKLRRCGAYQKKEKNG